MLIVNKHCAIFTTSIKRTLGKVPKVSLNRGFTVLCHVQGVCITTVANAFMLRGVTAVEP